MPSPPCLLASAAGAGNSSHSSWPWPFPAKPQHPVTSSVSSPGPLLPLEGLVWGGEAPWPGGLTFNFPPWAPTSGCSISRGRGSWAAPPLRLQVGAESLTHGVPSLPSKGSCCHCQHRADWEAEGRGRAVSAVSSGSPSGLLPSEPESSLPAGDYIRGRVGSRPQDARLGDRLLSRERTIQ